MPTITQSYLKNKLLWTQKLKSKRDLRKFLCDVKIMYGQKKCVLLSQL